MRALYTYDAQSPEEISLREGELLELSTGPNGGQNYAEGWWEGIDSSGKKGIFPSNYVSWYIYLFNQFYLLTYYPGGSYLKYIYAVWYNFNLTSREVRSKVTGRWSSCLSILHNIMLCFSLALIACDTPTSNIRYAKG